jgi:hypothetical protein
MVHHLFRVSYHHHLQHEVFVSSHIPIVLALCQEHVRVFVIATMHLVVKSLVEILIRVVVLERRSRLLVTLIPLLFLFPLPDLRDLTPSEVLISGLRVILFSGSRSVSHGHSLHQLLHGLHHHVKFFI